MKYHHIGFQEIPEVNLAMETDAPSPLIKSGVSLYPEENAILITSTRNIFNSINPVLCFKKLKHLKRSLCSCLANFSTINTAECSFHWASSQHSKGMKGHALIRGHHQFCHTCHHTLRGWIKSITEKVLFSCNATEHSNFTIYRLPTQIIVREVSL